MAWWTWVLIGFALLLFALAVLFLIGRSLWRKVKLLLAEMSAAAERFAVISEKLQQTAEATQAAAPAVFTSPTQIRQDQILARAKPGRHSR